MPGLVIAPDYGALLSRHIIARRARGLSAAVIERDQRHSTEFAARMTQEGVDLVDVHRQHIEAHLGGYSAKLTQQSVQVSLRLLFKSAVEFRMIAESPVAESNRSRTLEAPDRWAPIIARYHRSLIGRGLSKETYTQYVRYAKRFARAHEYVDINDITRGGVTEYLASLNVGRAHMRSQASWVHNFFTWAKDEEIIRKNPCKKLPTYRSDKGVPMPASDDDLTVALGLADDDEKLMLRLAAELGLRCGEISRVHQNDLTVREGLYSLRVLGKGSKVRVLPVTEGLAHAIHSRGPGFLFPGQVEGHTSAPYVSKRLSRLLPAGVTAHKLRHRFATMAYAATKDTFATQRLLGHASSATTEIYVQVDDTTLRTAVEAVGAHRGALDQARERANA